MLTIFYSPHMTSVDNEARRASGHADVPLAEAGRQQAQELGQHYADKAFDAVYCSDLQRATLTAQIAFANRGVPIVHDARLREYDYGDMTRYPVEQVEAEFPLRITEPFPHGESLLMAVQRVGAFLRDVSPTYDGKTLVIIGHRATRYGLEYWCNGAADQQAARDADGAVARLTEIVNAPWPWLAIPIWRYELPSGVRPSVF